MSKEELIAQFCVFGESDGAMGVALSAARHGADTVLILPDGTAPDRGKAERNLRILYGTAEMRFAEDTRIHSATVGGKTVIAPVFAQCRRGDFLGAVALSGMDTLSEQLLSGREEYARVIECFTDENETLYGVLFDCVCDPSCVNLYRADGTDAALASAVGTAAAIGAKYGVLPCEVFADHMDELTQTLLYDGAFLPHIRRTVSEAARTAELSCDDAVSGDILNLRTGIDTNSPLYGEGDQGFTMAKGATVEYHMDEAVDVTRARIVFDADGDALAKVYALEIEADGAWEGILFENENRRRLVTAAICRPITGIRLTVMETWGAQNVHIFAFDFE